MRRRASSERVYSGLRRRLRDSNEDLKRRQFRAFKNDLLEETRAAIEAAFPTGYLPEPLKAPLDDCLNNFLESPAIDLRAKFYHHLKGLNQRELEHLERKEPGRRFNNNLEKKRKALHGLLSYTVRELVAVFRPIVANVYYPDDRRAGFDKDRNFSVYLYQYVNDFPGVFRSLLSALILRVSWDTREELSKLSAKPQISAEELISYFKNTPLYNFFYVPLPLFPLPSIKRFEHMHVVATTGHGKTQLLLQFIYEDLLRAQDGRAGLCVIDSQGDLINTILRLYLFEPRLRQSLAEKLVLIDANDVEYPTCLNVFDIKQDRLKKMKSPLEREKAYNFAISLYGYIFSDLVRGELTMYQENIFQYCAKLLLNIPGATILTFIDLLEESDKYKKHMLTLDDLTRRFFEKEFYSKVYESTKKQIAARLWAVIRNVTFRNMFSSERNKVDMYEAMNKGKIVLINTSKELLQSEGARLLGKFFIALILQSAFQRAAIPEERRRPFYLYIDEAQDYMTDKLTELFSQARKYKIGVIIAHQFLKQLDDVSSNLRYGTLAGTSIKFVGKVDYADVKAFSDRVNVAPEQLGNLRKADRQFTEYYCHIKDTTPSAIKVRIPLGVVHQLKRTGAEGHQALINMNREKFCRQINLESAPAAEPAAATREERKEEGGFKLGKPVKL